MLRLVVNPGTGQAWHIPLRPGRNSIGRGAANDFQLNDPSVSSAHCEITVTPDAVHFKDLGSTNGSFLNLAPVQEIVLQNGQRLRLGSVELLCESVPTAGGIINLTHAARVASSPTEATEAPTALTPRAAVATAVALAPTPAPEAAAPPPPPVAAAAAPAPAVPPPPPGPVDATTAGATRAAVVESDVPVFCKNHYQNAARFYCAKCKRYLCDLCVNTRGMAGGGLTSCKICAQPVSLVSLKSHVPKEVNFFKSVGPAFKYPIAGDGIILLLLGFFLFGLLDGAYYIALNAGKFGMLGMRGMMMRAVVICFILGTGYLFSYLKKIVYATASGEHKLPDWPELSEWQADILAPMFQFLVISIISFGPAITVRIWYDGDHMWAVWSLMALGCFYFPMGLLGVAMFDSLAALNPLFVIGSILKVPGPYCVAALVFTAILGFRLLLEALLRWVLHIQFAVDEMISDLVAAFLSDLLAIYLLIVQTRILGMLYLARKDTLGWFKKRQFPRMQNQPDAA